MTDEQAHWNQRYETLNAPWNSGLPSQELQRVIAEQNWQPGRLLELGCGSGTNAVFLAKQGFEVTAVDFAPLALQHGATLAQQHGVEVRWICADVCGLILDAPPFDYVFDRGCYHCVRRDNLGGYLQTLSAATRTGSHLLALTGNANEERKPGPPVLHEHELRRELGQLFTEILIRPFHFEDAGHVQGPLGWSSLWRR